MSLNSNLIQRLTALQNTVNSLVANQGPVGNPVSTDLSVTASELAALEAQVDTLTAALKNVNVNFANPKEVVNADRVASRGSSLVQAEPDLSGVVNPSVQFPASPAPVQSTDFTSSKRGSRGSR